MKYDNYYCFEISGQTGNTATDERLARKMPSHELLPSLFVTSDCCFATAGAGDDSQSKVKQHSSTTLTHNKGFKSAYDLNEPYDVTSYVDDGAHLIDYLLYTQGKKEPHQLNVLIRLDLHKANEMGHIRLPNHPFPSDHFLLSAKFALKFKS